MSMVGVSAAGRGDRRGVAGLEFALTGSIILILLFAMFDVGLLFMYQCGIDYGADAAARWGAMNSATVTPSTLLTQFSSAAAGLLSNGVACTAYSSAGAVPGGTPCYILVSYSNGAVVGSVLTVQAYYAWSPAAPIGGFAATTLNSTVEVTIQN